MRRFLPVSICLLMAACGDLAEPSNAVPALGYDVFRSDVEPILVARCSNPSSCHGREDRPYAIYAPGANREDPADLYRDVPLSAAESRANFERSRSFAADFGYGAELLSKPLAVAAGGAPHTGGTIFVDVDDREYQTLETWIARPDYVE